MAELTEKAREIVEGKAFAHVATIGPDGTPHVNPVWIEPTADGGLSFNTAYGRQKAKNIARDPRVTLSIIDPASEGYTYVEIRGTAALVDEGADEQIDRLAKKYIGQDTYPWRSPDEKRVSVVITPSKVLGMSS